MYNQPKVKPGGQPGPYQLELPLEITAFDRGVCFTRDTSSEGLAKGANAQATAAWCVETQCRNGANAGMPGPTSTARTWVRQSIDQACTRS
jgi:hypothetical protein